MFDFRRAGALAPVVVLFATLSGTGLSGALAQDQAERAPLEQVTPEAPQPRFVSEPVVQEVPVSAEEMTQPVQAVSLAQMVSAMPTAGEMSSELTCLAQAVYFEARGEPLDGQLAVARVIINRTQSGRFPSDYCSVVTQPGQFSFVRRGAIPQPPAASPAWARAKAIARIAHQDLWDSAAGDSLYFHATHVRPGWARAKATVARIDSHVFYR